MLESLPTIVIVKMLILQTIIKFYSATILLVLEFLWEEFEAFYSRINRFIKVDGQKPLHVSVRLTVSGAPSGPMQD